MLPNPTPLTTDPVPAMVFDRLHLLSLSATSPSPNFGMLTVELIPATQDGILASNDKVQRMSCPLYPTINEVPELSAAFSAVLAAIPATQAYLTAKEEAEKVADTQS